MSQRGAEVYVPQKPEHLSIAAILIGLALVVVLPTAAAGWALAAWWPTSGAVWLAASALVWAVLMKTAADEPTVRRR